MQAKSAPMAESTLADDPSMTTTFDDTKSTYIKDEALVDKVENDNVVPEIVVSVSLDGEKIKDDTVKLEEKVNVKADSVEICRPCHVVLQRLTAEEIRSNTIPCAGNCVAFHQGSLHDRNLRVLESVGDSSLFQEFRKTRKEYLKRKRRRSSETFFGFYSGEEFTFQSDEDYFFGESEDEDSQGRKKRRRKKHNYEDDTEWAPPTDYKGLVRPTRHKKSSKSLRVNTRRKRIESASSESSDEEQHPYSTRTKHLSTKPPDQSFHYDAVYDPGAIHQPAKKKAPVPSGGKSKARDEDLPSNPADNDLVSKILREMADYTNSTAKNGTSEVHLGEGSANFPYPHTKRPYQKKRVSRVIRSAASNSVAVVQDLVNDMVNSVCSIEGRKQTTGVMVKKKCKWCDTPFHNSNPSEILCAICRDLGMNEKALSNKKKGKATGVKANAKNTPARSKMIHRVFKNLPKYEKQKIMYSSKVNASSVEKGYNHCKSLFDSKDVKDTVSGSEVTEKSPVKKKRKTKAGKGDGSQPVKLVKKKKTPLSIMNSSAEGLKATSEVRHRAAQVLKSTAGSNQTQMSLTGIDKGLFLMTFPEPHHGLDTPQSSSEQNVKPSPKEASNKFPQPVANNVQYGTYLLPPVPTVVVANYAATDAKSGDYYLSSLYYQNEMTQSKNAAAQNDTPALPSMPSMDQLSNENNAVALPQTYQFGAQSAATEAMGSVNESLTDVLQPSMCSSDSNLSSLLNNPHLQIDAVPIESFEHEAGVENLLNSQLGIDAFPMTEGLNDSLDNELLSANGNANKESSHMEEQSDNMLGTSEPDPETRPVSRNMNDTEPSDASKMGENDLNNQSKSLSDTNCKTSAPEEAASKTSRLVYEGLDLLKNSCAELDAICIMSVVDLDENPKGSLYRYVESNIKDYEKLKRSEAQNESIQQKLKSLADNTHVLSIAQNYLRTYGSFAKFSDSLLLRAKLLQIKKEAFEQETMSSCQFAAKAAPAKEAPVNVESVSNAVRIKMEHAGACSEDIPPPNFISKIQNQVDNMQNAPAAERMTPLGGVVHHFPLLNPGMTTALSATPRSDLLNESRETPSRGSGPRTPARPESAMSQAEDLPLTPLQIKKERMEAAASPLQSQCAYSQNASPHLTAPSPVTYPQNAPPPYSPAATETSHLPLPTQMMQTANMTPHIGGSNPPQVQNFVHFQNTSGPPNVTVPFSTAPTFQKVLVNVSQKQPQRLGGGINTNQNTNVIIKNGQLYNLQQVQQVYLPRAPSLQQRIDVQTSTSVMNMNQLVFKQTPVTSNSGGTMIVNSGGQGMYPVQNRFSNLPVPQQSSQICSTLQQNVQNIQNPVNPQTTGFLMNQNNKVVFFEIQRSQ